MKVGELREELLRGNPELQVAYRVEELEAEVERLREVILANALTMLPAEERPKMSDSPSERENLTAALVREHDTKQLVEWIHALQDREAELEAEVERLREALAECLEYLEPSFFDEELLVLGVVKRARAALAGQGTENPSRDG